MFSARQQDEVVLVMNFGSQYAHLICRRVREQSVYAELVSYTTSAEDLSDPRIRGLILSGGPASVYGEGAPLVDPKIFSLNIPVLGICYGLQLMTHQLGGIVAGAARREYGLSELTIDEHSDLFKGLGNKMNAWMSHGDKVERLPKGFEIIGHTDNSEAAAIRDAKKRLYGVQFHPEVSHTPRGRRLLRNFLMDVCGCKGTWRMSSFVRSKVEEIREKTGGERVLCAVSGGVDSMTTAALVHKAIGDRLTCIFVDHGLLRKGEPEEVISLIRDNLGIRLVHVDASKQFLERLAGVSEPEEKRKLIGEEFVKVFSTEGLKHGSFEWLAQGTLYPDVIESAMAIGPTQRIKTHHNVAGLPRWMSFKLLEPLRELYKDEVRRAARILGLPSNVVWRHPFPGPGLAVRVIGEVTPNKLSICRDASYIVEEEIRRAGLYQKVWQAFAVVGDDRAVGVLGDERGYGYIVTVRVTESRDAMTADWARLPYEVLQRISRRITNEISCVTWVNYAISSKPPSTIEPQ